jgi:FkbM family methyltransferase
MLINFSSCVEIINSIHKSPITKVFHIGAHEGQEAEAYHAQGVKKIVWFEANTDLITTLHQHLMKFPNENLLIPKALWNDNTQLNFNITNNGQSSSFFELKNHSNYYPDVVVAEKKYINAYRLDSIIESTPNILEWHDFDFINIDTQGSELAILQGIGKYLDQDCLKGIYVEVNSEELYKGIPMVDEIDSYLRQFNFHRCVSHWTNAGWGDALYVKSLNLYD